MKFFYVYVIVNKHNERIRYFGITTSLRDLHGQTLCRRTSPHLEVPTVARRTNATPLLD